MTDTRVGLIKGSANALAADGEASRSLTLGAPIFEDDKLTTVGRSYAILIFGDRSRVILTANTQFKVAEFRDSERDGRENSVVFQPLSGGLRAVTGLIGKRNPGRVKYTTRVATIGIRGTSLDLICQDACGAEHTASLTLQDVLQSLSSVMIADVFAAPASNSGLFAVAREGTIVL